MYDPAVNLASGLQMCHATLNKANTNDVEVRYVSCTSYKKMDPSTQYDTFKIGVERVVSQALQFSFAYYPNIHNLAKICDKNRNGPDNDAHVGWPHASTYIFSTYSTIPDPVEYCS